MPMPRRVGIAIAALYLAGAGLVVFAERGASGFLPYLGTFLVTAPFSVLLSWIGYEPDFTSVYVALALLAVTAVLVYEVAFGLTRLLTRGRQSS